MPTLEELIVQHCVVMAMEDMLWRGMYSHTYASIPGRGTHKAKKVIEKWIDRDPKNMKYVLKMDIHHFFDSIPHDILKAKLARKIHDEQMLDLLFKSPRCDGSGDWPAGVLHLAMALQLVLAELDHFIKEKAPRQELCPIHGRP